MKTITVRKSLFDILERRDTRPLVSSVINKFLIFLVLANVAAASMETVEDFNQRLGSFLYFIEIFSISIFTIEYSLRWWISKENKNYRSQWQYVLSPAAIIDLISILPFYISLLFGIDLKALVVLRLFRLLKLIRYFEPLGILGKALRAEFSSFMSALFILFILIMVASTGMYVFEKDVQPELFGSIPQSMWWSVVTLTTLGYGDVVPATVLGKIFAGVITVLSIGTVALPAGMLASRFSEELKNRKENFKGLAVSLQKNGHLCERSQETLEKSRKASCLSKDEANLLINEACSQRKNNCPYCGEIKNG